MRPKTIELDTRVRRHDATLKQDVAGALMLFHMDEGQYFSLDGVGARVWELCDGSRSVADVIAVICAEYDAVPSTISDDVLHLIQELSGEHLVVEADASG